MDVFTVVRKSRDTAEGDDIILRETKTTRLVFKPLLVNNAQDKNAPVKGSFVFQRKRKEAVWEDHNEVRLSSLKADEWVKLDLKSGEVHTLVRHLAGLYRLYKREGLPEGKVHFIKVDLGDEGQNRASNIEELIRLISRGMSIDALSELVKWAVSAGNAQEVLSQLNRLDVQSLQQLSGLVGLSSLKRLLELWKENQANNDEEFWQKNFQENAFVLSQVFSFPVVILQGKAYVGGKAIDNKGGHLVDFLASNPITKNAVIVEIKTPATKLLGKEYRTGVFVASDELAGALIQALNYQNSLMTDFLSVRRKHEGKLEVFSPRCLVIIGNAGSQLTSSEKLNSFEVLRGGFKDVSVITYDELFAKTEQLIEALEGTNGFSSLNQVKNLAK